MKTNPLMTFDCTKLDIDFESLSPIHFQQAIDILIPLAIQEHETAIEKGSSYLEIFESYPSHTRFDLVVSVMDMLLEFSNDKKLRKIQEKYLDKITDFKHFVSFDKRMFNKYEQFVKTDEFKNLNIQKQEAIEEIIKDLKVLGIDLNDEQKQKFNTLDKKLNQYSNKFEENLIEGEAEFFLLLTLSDLKGCPERVIEDAAELAAMNKKKGYMIDQVSGLLDDVLMYATDENLRKKIYQINKKTCRTGKFDNTSLIDKIYKLYHQKAKILGFENFAKLSLYKNMLKEPQEVKDFLNSLLDKSHQQAVEENKKVFDFGKSLIQKNPQAWDYSYILNHMKKDIYEIDQEELRKYFPIEHVVKQFFKWSEELFEVRFEKQKASVWHSDVEFFKVYELQNQEWIQIGGLFFDIYTREGKKSGASVLPLLNRELDVHNKLQLPLAILNCNNPKSLTEQSTFTFGEFTTFFHEMGHALHHLLSKVDENYFSGLESVELDAVELPSQLMENFCFDYNVLSFVTKHIETGNVLPKEMAHKLIEAKTFMGASTVVEFAKYSLMDMNLYTQNIHHPYEIETQLNHQYALSDWSDKDNLRMPTFSHIFGGGYSAGYYSYQWAEVLVYDAYAAFKEVENDKSKLKEVGKEFKRHILGTAGYGNMKDKFKLFRKRDAEISYFLESYGIENTNRPEISKSNINSSKI